MVDWAQLTLFIYVTARMSGFVLFNPILGRNGVPAIFRAGLVLVLSVCVMSFTTQQVEPPAVLLAFGLRIFLDTPL